MVLLHVETTRRRAWPQRTYAYALGVRLPLPTTHTRERRQSSRRPIAAGVTFLPNGARANQLTDRRRPRRCKKVEGGNGRHPADVFLIWRRLADDAATSSHPDPYTDKIRAVNYYESGLPTNTKYKTEKKNKYTRTIIKTYTR